MKKLNLKKAVALVAIATAGFTGNVKGQWLWTGGIGTSDIYTQNLSGNVGVGLSSPTYKLHVETGTAGDGILLNQTAGGDATLFLQQSSANYWALNHNSSGDFSIINSASGNTPLLITAATENVTIGGNALTPNARLELSETSGTVTSAVALNAYAVGGTVDNYGVYGNTAGTVGSGENIGVYGSLNNTAGTLNAAIYGNANGNVGATDWAGYFAGNVYINGAITSTGAGMFGVSDRKLKNNIQPLVNSLDKLLFLKPSSYTFKVDEFAGMNLPKGEQIGLIAQELEEVFPDMVREVAAQTKIDAKGNKSEKIPAHKTVNYTALIPVIIGALQEEHKIAEVQQQQLSQQAQEIQELKNQMTALQQQQQQQQNATTGIKEINSSDNIFYMKNIPNPYTTETTIKYTLSQSFNSALLVVYDLSGKQLASYNLNKTETSLVINANDLAAGIYLYSIIADGKIMGTERMVVSGK